MQKESYKKLLDKTRNHKAKLYVLKTMYKFLPILMLIIYPLMLVIKGIQGIDYKLILMVAVPAGVLLLVTLMRKIIKRERPYEKFEIPALFDREGVGASFPSRHTASAFIIAMSGFTLSPYVGIGLLIIATAIGLTRIFSGVHYTTDVLAGMLLSSIIGTIAFIMI